MKRLRPGTSRPELFVFASWTPVAQRKRNDGLGAGRGRRDRARPVGAQAPRRRHRYEAYLAWSDRLHAIVVVKMVRPHLAADPHTLAGLPRRSPWSTGSRTPSSSAASGPSWRRSAPPDPGAHRGPRVSSFVRRHGPLPAEQPIPLALQLASALHYLAAEGVVHLDLKPANIIMSGPPRLIDLSVAVDLEGAAALRSPVGTDSYMAPEQCLPGELGPVGPPADVWGLGATLYRAATGERPFGRATRARRARTGGRSSTVRPGADRSATHPAGGLGSDLRLPFDRPRPRLAG